MANERFTIEDLLKRGYAPDGKGGFIRSKAILYPSGVQEQKNTKNHIKRKKKTNDRPEDARNDVEDGFLFPIYSQIELQVKIRQKNNTRRDLDGVLSCIMDCLVKAGIIKDDRMQIVSRIIVNYEKYDRNETEIQLFRHV